MQRSRCMTSLSKCPGKTASDFGNPLAPLSRASSIAHVSSPPSDFVRVPQQSSAPCSIHREAGNGRLASRDTGIASRAGSWLRNVARSKSRREYCHSSAIPAAFHGVLYRFPVSSPTPGPCRVPVTAPTIACPPSWTWTCSTVTFCWPALPRSL